MAKTYPVQQVKILTDFDAFGGKWTYQEEGAAQGATQKGAPLLWNAGQVDQTASPPAAGTVMGFAMQDFTGVQGTRVKVIDQNWIFAAGYIDANLVTSVDPVVDRVFALADLGADYDLVLDATSGLWSAIDGVGGVMKGKDVRASFLFPDEESDLAEVGDTNVRLRFQVLEVVLDV